MFNADPNTASGAYGFGSWSPSVPGGVAVMPETQIGSVADIPGQVLGKLGPHPMQNPLFWLLVLALIWTGYVYGGFNFGLKKIGSTRTRIGR